MTVSCVIPFYNEADRIVRVLNEVVQVKSIQEIICVDDGSIDSGADIVKKHYPQIKLISNAKNLGKTKTIEVGTQHAKGDYILMLDADLRNLKAQEIEAAVVATLDKEPDMVILRRVNAALIIRLNRGETLLSGERIIKKQDLLNIIGAKNKRPVGFQLEFAINQYMQANQKTACWMPSSALNTYPTTKRGFIKGMGAIVAMQVDILRYIGLVNFLQQELFFCRKKLT